MIREVTAMLKFLLWLILLVLSWPLALLSLIAYPLVWLLLLPIRLVGIVLEGLLNCVEAMLALLGRMLSGGSGRGA